MTRGARARAAAFRMAPAQHKGGGDAAPAGAPGRSSRSYRRPSYSRPRRCPSARPFTTVLAAVVRWPSKAASWLAGRRGGSRCCPRPEPRTLPARARARRITSSPHSLALHTRGWVLALSCVSVANLTAMDAIHGPVLLILRWYEERAPCWSWARHGVWESPSHADGHHLA